MEQAQKTIGKDLILGEIINRFVKQVKHLVKHSITRIRFDFY